MRLIAFFISIIASTFLFAMPPWEQPGNVQPGGDAQYAASSSQPAQAEQSNGAPSATSQVEIIPIEKFPIGQSANAYFNITQKGNLGSGSFGTVSTGRYKGMPVAVKELKTSYKNSDTTWREFSLLSELNHPSIAPIIAIITVPLPHMPGTISRQRAISHFVFPLYQKETLFDYFYNDTAYDSHQLATWFLQLADALGEIHSRGMIHRDIKPNNLLLTPNLDLVLADFGEAIRPGPACRSTESAGTFYFQAPETYPAYFPNGEMCPYQLSPTIDIYSFGITLWLMLAKPTCLPNEASLTTFSQRIRSGHVRPQIPSNLQDLSATQQILYKLAMACWARDPNQRPSIYDIKVQLSYVLSFPAEPIKRTGLWPLSTSYCLRPF